jgi:hypothetical protein
LNPDPTDPEHSQCLKAIDKAEEIIGDSTWKPELGYKEFEMVKLVS